MKTHHSCKIFIDGQPVDLKNLEIFSINEDWQKSIINFLQEFTNNQTYVEVKTSGSTGTPKTIKLSKNKMRNSATMTGSFLGLKSGVKALLCLNADYIAGKMMLVRAMTLGLELHCISPIGANISELNTSYDFCAMVPLQALKNISSIDKIKKLIIGGSDISTLGKERLIALKHHGIYQTFGMTETISHIALKKINETEYRCLPEIEVSLSENQTLKIEAPLLLEKAIETNDLVNITSPTSFEWLGRIDNIINSGGVKIIPEKVENILSTQIDVPFFVAALPDDILGQKLMLISEGKNVEFSKDEALKLGLDTYEIPKENIVIDSFVRTNTGKINRLKTLDLIH